MRDLQLGSSRECVREAQFETVLAEKNTHVLNHCFKLFYITVLNKIDFNKCFKCFFVSGSHTSATKFRS